MGSAYAIEFHWAALHNTFSQAPDILLGRVEYDERCQDELVRGIVACPALKTASELKTGTFLDRVRQGFEMVAGPLLEAFTQLTVCRAFLKSPSFAEESERRIVSLRQKRKAGAAFRPRHGVLVPYVPLKIWSPDHKLPIARIFVGPTLHPDQARHSLEGFLASKGLDEVRVVASSVPLRA